MTEQPFAFFSLPNFCYRGRDRRCRRRPRTDPYVKNYLIRLFPWVPRSGCNIPTSRSRVRRCVADSGTVSGATKSPAAFPLGAPLPSTDSAAGVPVLFVRFAGTMGPSDFPRASMPAVPSEAFSGRSNLPEQVGNSWDLPVLATGVSTPAQGLRLRRAATRLAMNRRAADPEGAPPSTVRTAWARESGDQRSSIPGLRVPLTHATPATLPSPA